MFNNKLFNEILKFGSFNNFVDFAIFIGKMKNLSVFNAAMIFCQRPGAIWVETEKDWASRGRFLKPNATPLVILKPFAPVEFVYEYEETVGDDLPFLSGAIQQTEIEELNGVNLNAVFCRLNDNLIYVAEKPLGERQSGFVEVPKEEILVEVVKGNGNLFILPAQYAIILNKNKSVSQKFLTIIHELGHLFCGHLPLPESAKTDKKRLVKFDRSDLSVNTMEHEAEAVCKLVCERINVKYDNYEYLNGYKENGKAPDINMNVVISAADEVRKLLHIKNLI